MLKVQSLSVDFILGDSTVNAVKDISFSVAKGQTLGILGESGSGKSTIASAILNLISTPGKIVSGQVFLDDKDILKLSEKEMEAIRGAKISIIFQDPFSSLNPVLTVGDQVSEAIILHQKLEKTQANQKTSEMFKQVKLPPERMRHYPHELSGGMRQRVMIAMALACNPDYLIADEPTTALDVTIQKEILELISELQNKLGFGMIFITHNFRIAKNICDDFIVLKDGAIVDSGKEIFANPKSDYTKELVLSMGKLYGRPVN